jgi:hypothetical protein
MDLSLINQVSGLGLGAVIAVVLIIWKRGDDQRREREMSALIGRMEDTAKSREAVLVQLVRDNTAAMQSLEAAVSRLGADVTSHRGRGA